MEPITADTVKAAISGALVSRGPRKGLLLSKCPPVNTDAAAAWQAVVSHANPYKMGIGHVLFMDSRRREIFDRVDREIKTQGLDVRGLDRDRAALEALGAW